MCSDGKSNKYPPNGPGASEKNPVESTDSDSFCRASRVPDARFFLGTHTFQTCASSGRIVKKLRFSTSSKFYKPISIRGDNRNTCQHRLDL